MNAKEIAMLCRYVQALCPAQKFDEYTADAWLDVLGSLPYQLAKRAAVEAASRQTFVSPSDIKNTLKAMRAALRPAVRKAAEEAQGEYPADPSPAAWPEFCRQRKADITNLVDHAIESNSATWDDGPIIAAATIWRSPLELEHLPQPELVDRREQLKTILGQIEMRQP